MLCSRLLYVCNQDWYRCKYTRANFGATCKSYEFVDPTEESLKATVATVGPVAAAVDGLHYTFKHYRKDVYDGDIYDDPNCGKRGLNHAVLVIGYGTENGKDYWLVKNRYLSQSLY